MVTGVYAGRSCISIAYPPSMSSIWHGTLASQAGGSTVGGICVFTCTARMGIAQPDPTTSQYHWEAAPSGPSLGLVIALSVAETMRYRWVPGSKVRYGDPMRMVIVPPPF